MFRKEASMRKNYEIESKKLDRKEGDVTYYKVVVVDGEFRSEMIMISTATMELVYSEADPFFCSVLFYVNGVAGELFDFGEKDDGGSYYDEFETPHCADMHFVPARPSEKILKKYGITESDFEVITDMLVEQLAFGLCSMCW